jgi:hypothetical protein
MSQLPTAPAGPPYRAKPANDIYTVMVAIALSTVAGTLAFAVIRCLDLLGKPFPGI